MAVAVDHTSFDGSESPAASLRAHPPIDDAVIIVQNFARKWPEPLRLPCNAHFETSDSDRGFERLLRECLEGRFPHGDVSTIRDLRFGGDGIPAIVPQHELDLILRCDEGKFVLEAKAWSSEVDKEPVIVFLAKVLDFLAGVNMDAPCPIRLGFIGLNGFSDAALRIMFAYGITPFTGARPNQYSFQYLDSLLGKAVGECQREGWEDTEQTLRERRSALTPFTAQEGRDLCKTVYFDEESAIVDVECLRRASEMFDESRDEHTRALQAYRAFLSVRTQRGGQRA